MATEPAEQYGRRDIAADVTFYSRPDNPSGDKTLLIGFTGRLQRLMLPIAAILQALPARLHDVVVLRDRDHDHYESGIKDYASSLVELTERLHADLQTDRYRRVVTLGTSMGGFPALRAGIVIGADRALALGGRPTWHVGRLVAPNPRPNSAFDLLCPCAPSGPPLYCVYSPNIAEDVDAIEGLAAMRPIHRIEVPEASRHNVLAPFWKKRRLAAFMTTLLERDPGRTMTIDSLSIKPNV